MDLTPNIYMLGVIASLLLTAGGQVLFKRYYGSHRRLDLLAALAMFGLVPITNFIALRGLPFGFVYMSTAVTQVLVLVMSRMFLAERIHPKALPGVVLVVAGIIVYAL